MSKRKAQDFGDEESSKRSKHTLDSDEEDDAKNYDVMDEEDIEGQEEATIDFDGDIRITPFNMREELEEGHFDRDGNYFLNKDEDEIRDEWLDNIDWVKVKRPGKEPVEEDKDTNEPIDEMKIFQQMLVLMKPGETVQRAIQRLGGGKSSASASNKWKKKKQGDQTAEISENAEEIEARKSQMLALTDLANQIIQDGNLEIYQDTYEKLNFRIQLNSNTPVVHQGLEDNAVPDMFSDTFEEKVAQPPHKMADPPLPDVVQLSEKSSASDSDLMWEFKWENSDTAEIYGPHSTSEMHQWVENGYFSQGVWVRKANQKDAHFYSSSRIDFELYL